MPDTPSTTSLPVRRSQHALRVAGADSMVARPPGRRATEPDKLPHFGTYDRMLRAIQARATQGLSPAVVAAAWLDWAFNLASAPGKQAELAIRASVMAARFALWLPKAAAGP